MIPPETRRLAEKKMMVYNASQDSRFHYTYSETILLIKAYYCIKCRVARYQQPCFKRQNPCINQAIHVLLMHSFGTLHIRILGRHKN